MKRGSYFVVLSFLGVTIVMAAKMATPTPSKSVKASPSPDCFPANAMVSLEHGQSIRMDQLKVGQRVAVGNGLYSEVFMFTHDDVLARRSFLRFTTENGFHITLSHGHYIRVGNVLVAANAVTVGDSLVLQNGSRSKVVDIRVVQDKGLFNPQTIHGDIVVNGVVASTYTTALDAKVAHAALAPLRFIANRFGKTIMWHNEMAALIGNVVGTNGKNVLIA